MTEKSDIIQTLRHIPTPAGMPDWQWLTVKVQATLMLTGFKQATSVHFNIKDTVSNRLVQELSTRLKQIGFITKDEVDAGYIYLHVAISAAALDRLQYALSGTISEAEADRIHGELSGFPLTAQDAFINGSSIDPEDLESEVRMNPAYIFGAFRYSKDHWQEELKTGEKWAETVRKADPELYAEFLKTFRGK